MDKLKTWYNAVNDVRELLLKDRTNKNSAKTNKLLSDQIQKVLVRYEECEAVGFIGYYSETDQIVTNVIAQLTISIPKKIEERLLNPSFRFYISLIYLEKALAIIRDEFKESLPETLKFLEDLIYKNDDYQNLIEVSRNIGRKIINKELHEDFSVLKTHIEEQLQFLKQRDRYNIENPDIWVEWLCKNPQLAEKYYPETMKALSEKIRKTPPYLTASIIQKTPEHFKSWTDQVDQLIGKSKQKKIKEIISYLKDLLNGYKFETEIEKQAVESVREELEEQLEIWENRAISLCEVSNSLASSKKTIDQIALYSYYTGISITRANANEIAKRYGHRSGEKLFQRYTYYISDANRKGKPIPCTPTKLKNKITLFEKVALALPDEQKKKAQTDIVALKRLLEDVV